MRSFIIVAALMAAAAGTAEAAETTTVQTEAKSALALTIYGDGVAFVREGREVELPSGRARVAFAGISREMIAGSAWLATADGARVVSLDSGFDLLTPEALLRRAVGGPVLVIRTHPQTGEETAEAATLLAAEGGIVVRRGERIETVPADRIAFPSLPAGLAAAPSLTATLDVDVPGRQPLTLSYLTGGLGWTADYVVTFDEKARRAAITGRAAITNTTGAAFVDARVGLIAGHLNRIAPAPPPQPRAMRVEAMAAPAADGAPPEREAIADLHLYRLAEPVTIEDRQTRQFTLFDVGEVPVVRSYISEAGGSWQPLRGGEPLPKHPRVRLTFTAPKGEAAQPFPAGGARVSGRDGKGDMRLIGEDRVPPTPAGGRIDLEPGEAFDITVRRRQTDFIAAREPNAFTEMAWQITVENAKDEAADVRLIERLPGDWKILTETTPHEKVSADRVAWTLPVPAHGKAEMAYRVRVQR